MNTDDLVSRLDEAFGIAASAEDLEEFAVVDDVPCEYCEDEDLLNAT